ncbi:hypothetical protein CH373_10040 [Leptospira perolatii]|uniref:Uncharacterized protein n=1 Tax=Leptospira perolatii TaxID=2023191 RepID=A0A2M9ZMY9_9LEPT|nr:hypothetical protein [Leptospira perolatii]PJZ70114.1 hypothetical protein CH360_07785 [Leptospira perolatii]PJZ73303.1 hypothetical protein CH373_10040 [Leptospira perolatii]
MEKFRFGVIAALVLMGLVIVYALLKSWLVYDQGIEVSKSASKKVETTYVEPDDDLLEHSSVAWGKYLYYPLNLNRDRENFGARKVLNHAQNLIIVNLSTGRIRTVFSKSVYIWDYFYGESSSQEILDESASESHPDVFPGLRTGKQFIIIGMPEDTNKDGFLNQKDSKKVFVYDPSTENLEQILPKKFYLEKIMPDSPQDRLVMIVRREEEPEGSKKKPFLPTVFIYDTANRKGKMVQRL